jgi:hypothetical protein
MTRADGEDGASPMQRRGISRTWHAPTTRDFLRALRWRSQFGRVYAIIGDHDRADIMVRSLDWPERWLRLYTYPKVGLAAMGDAGLLSMREVRASEIPGFDPESIQATEADRARFGPDPAFWLIEVPDDGSPVVPPRKRPYDGPR